MTHIISESRSESKCGGCNWETSTFYSSSDPMVANDKDSWLCASCFMDMLVENKTEFAN